MCSFLADRRFSSGIDEFHRGPALESWLVLILTRKVGETIMVGDKIRVVVVDVKGRQVRIGVDAPADTKIYRGEIFDKIQEENNRASRVDAQELKNAADLWSRIRSGRGGDGD